MRVLMTTGLVGGVWTYALELARALEVHGVRILLATLGAPASAAQREAVACLPHVQLREGVYPLEWMESPRDDVARAGDWLLRLEAEFAPDVVHLNGFVHAALPWRAPVVVVGNSYVLSWEDAVRGDEPSPASQRYRAAVAAGLAAADMLVAPSQAMIDATRRLYGATAQSRVIPYGRDPGPFAPAAKEPIILAVGCVRDEAKNIVALERVAPRLSWPVQIAGDMGSPDRATHRGPERRYAGVRYLGHLEEHELAVLFARAAIYALPARYEPFGLSVLEAALCACALVLGDVPSLRELWGAEAVFVPANDDDALRRALQRLIADPIRCAELGERARARALCLSPARQADEYVRLYQEVAALKQAPSVVAACAS